MKPEWNYDAHKLNFLSLKWAVTYSIHEYLYSGKFEVYIDNNLLTYILTTSKFDVIGQRWVDTLAPYDSNLHYNLGWQNVIGDSLSRLLWSNLDFRDSMEFNLVKAYVTKGEVNLLACIKPDMLEEHLTLQVHQLVDSIAGKITKAQWKKEQMSDT